MFLICNRNSSAYEMGQCGGCASAIAHKIYSHRQKNRSQNSLEPCIGSDKTVLKIIENCSHAVSQFPLLCPEVEMP